MSDPSAIADTCAYQPFANMLRRLAIHDAEHLLERAAILEYDGRMSRFDAERQAVRERVEQA